MSHLVHAGQGTLGYLAVAIVVGSLLVVAASSQAVRAGVAQFLAKLSRNPVRTYFYGPADDEPGDGQLDASNEQADDSSSEDVDDFDYSIFSQSNPPTT